MSVDETKQGVVVGAVVVGERERERKREGERYTGGAEQGSKGIRY